MAKNTIAPEEALEKIFDVVREWASNPANAHHLISVLGLTVEYPKVDVAQVSPLVLVKSRSEEEFHRIFGTLTLAELKKVFTNNRLAATSELKGMKAGELLSELYIRAKEKAAETTVR